MKKILVFVLVMNLSLVILGCNQASSDVRVLEQAYKTMIRSDNYRYTSIVVYTDNTVAFHFSIDDDLLWYTWERENGSYWPYEVFDQYISFKDGKETLYTMPHNPYWYQYDPVRPYRRQEADDATSAVYDEVRNQVLIELLHTYDRIVSVEDDKKSWTYVLAIDDFDIERLTTVANKDFYPFFDPVGEIEFTVRINKWTKRIERFDSAFVFHAFGFEPFDITYSVRFDDYGRVRLKLPEVIV